MAAVARKSGVTVGCGVDVAGGAGVRAGSAVAVGDGIGDTGIVGVGAAKGVGRIPHWLSNNERKDVPINFRNCRRSMPDFISHRATTAMPETRPFGPKHTSS